MMQTQNAVEGEPDHPGAWLGWAAGALAVVGVVIVAVLWLLLPRFHPGIGPDGASGPSLELPASEFAAVTGRDVERQSDALVIGSLQEGEAVFAIREFFEAGDYPMLRLALSGVHPDLETELYWTTADAPLELNYLPLARGDEAVTWHRLAGRDGWEGRIVELGVVVYGLRDEGPMRLESMRLQPATRAALARLTWQHWHEFQTWRQGAPNYYRGVPEHAPLRPVPVAAAWLLGSVAVLIVAARIRRWRPKRLLPAAIVAALVPWLALDLLWQDRLADQVGLTRATFTGLDQAARRDREMDATLRWQVAEIRAALAPLRGKRLFLVHDSRRHNYHRLRAQYHLLPLNVYNFGRDLPDPADVRAGDYLLVLDETDRVRFDAGRDALHDADTELPARVVERQPRMTLYRLSGEGSDR
ncbi:MAG: hypothetical protein ACNS61_02585 [Candidatus Wenzhouxiangella sp. M2_3B_020]